MRPNPSSYQVAWLIKLETERVRESKQRNRVAAHAHIVNLEQTVGIDQEVAFFQWLPLQTNTDVVAM